MDEKQQSLDEDVLAVFQRACREGNLAVAEHLLRALETIAGQDEAQEYARRAYTELIRLGQGRS
jgi:hypothetical protein